MSVMNINGNLGYLVGIKFFIAAKHLKALLTLCQVWVSAVDLEFYYFSSISLELPTEGVSGKHACKHWLCIVQVACLTGTLRDKEAQHTEDHAQKWEAINAEKCSN
eukprot:6490077-Amphidinium_carterae.1